MHVKCHSSDSLSLNEYDLLGTVYWQAEERDGILLMSAYCVYCCASPLFLSSVLMAHLNKALNVSTKAFHYQERMAEVK